MSELRFSDDINRPLGRPRVMPEGERRQQIVDAAAVVFSKKGYWATTMDEVSRQAGMSKKTVYQHFSSKADIFDLLLEGFTHSYQLPFEETGRTPRQVLTEGLFRLAVSALDERHVELTRVLIAEAARPGDVADAIEREGICRGDWALKQWLASQTELGRYPIDDPEQLASTLFWAAVGDPLFKLLLRIAPRPKSAEIAATVERVVSLYFDAPA